MKTGRISDLLHHTINHITSSCFHRNRYQTSCRGVFLGSCYLRQWCASWRTMVSGYSSLAWAWGGSVKVFCKLIPFLHGQVQRSLVKLSWESLIHQKLSGAVRWGEIFPPTSLSPCLLPHLPLHLYFHLLLHLPSHLPLDILSTSLSPSFPSSVQCLIHRMLQGMWAQGGRSGGQWSKRQRSQRKVSPALRSPPRQQRRKVCVCVCVCVCVVSKKIFV